MFIFQCFTSKIIEVGISNDRFGFIRLTRKVPGWLVFFSIGSMYFSVLSIWRLMKWIILVSQKSSLGNIESIMVGERGEFLCENKSNRGTATV